jgi:hemolysin III
MWYYTIHSMVLSSAYDCINIYIGAYLLTIIKAKVKDPVSGYTHAFGVALSVIGIIMLLVKATAAGDSAWHFVGFSVFGAGLILLYSASSLYHLLNLKPAPMLIFRKIDHIMIFVLIAATYTPICLIPLNGLWGWWLFGAVWGSAVAGIVMKALFFKTPRWLSTANYLVLGWACVICIAPILHTIPSGGLILLLAGGIAYSAGAVIYAAKWPRRNARNFGFHELFHILILIGSLCHFLMMYIYLIPMTV